MQFLIVLAHPLPDSFAAGVAQAARQTLEKSGHGVDLLDLYAEDFDPRLSRAERAGYFDVPYETSVLDPIVARLRAADGLILVFPQWWFNFPAILKGFFDRVFVPGVAFDHDKERGRIVRKLTNIRLFYAFTTTGTPWWVARLAMGDPVRRLLRRGLAPFCARDVAFRMLALHDMDRTTDTKRAAHLRRVERLLSRIATARTVP